jgi:hypothetical protein
LAQAVGGFARITQGVPDAALDRAWAWKAYDSEGVRFAFFRTCEELRELAVRVTTERAAGGEALSPAQRILAQYHAAYRDLDAALLGITPEEADVPPAEGEWPLRTVVSHVLSADVFFYGGVRYALDRHRSGDGRPAEIPEEAWDAFVGMEEAAFEALLAGPLVELRAYHAAFHEKVLREFASISQAELELPSMLWESEPMSLRFRLHRFDSHVRQHTVQADKALVTIGRGPSEARRLLRLIYAALAEVEGATIGAWDVGAALRRDVADAISARAEEIGGILVE